MQTEQKVILSADELNKDELFSLLKKVGSLVNCIKIHNLFDLHGPSIVSDLKNAGAKRVWVDFKLHDIPNTVKLRAKALSESGCDIITVHASGGIEMMLAAKQAFGSGKVYAVTALTSLSDEMVKEIYNSSGAEELVNRLALLVRESGVDGLVCSPKEISILRSNRQLTGLELVVPGIRSAGVETNDQRRFATPENAIKAGANFLVIGRQITKAANPVEALKLLEKEILNALGHV
jgi:orotidine-5'-phosphate decarboxylase